MHNILESVNTSHSKHYWINSGSSDTPTHSHHHLNLNMVGVSSLPSKISNHQSHYFWIREHLKVCSNHTLSNSPIAIHVGWYPRSTETPIHLHLLIPNSLSHLTIVKITLSISLHFNPCKFTRLPDPSPCLITMLKLPASPSFVLLPSPTV